MVNKRISVSLNFEKVKSNLNPTLGRNEGYIYHYFLLYNLLQSLFASFSYVYTVRG